MRKKEKVWERERERRPFLSLPRARCIKNVTSFNGHISRRRSQGHSSSGSSYSGLRLFAASIAREKSVCYPSCRKIFFDDDHWKRNREYHRLMIILIIFPYEFTYSISNERQNFSFKKLFIWSGQARKIMYVFNLSSVTYQSYELTSMLPHVSIRWSSYFLLISK